MRLSIRTTLDYDFAEPADLLLQLEAAIVPDQTVEAAHIDIGPVEHFARVAGHDRIGDRIWLRVKDKLTVDYHAAVSVLRPDVDVSALPAVPLHRLPGETVEYLMPSRYCAPGYFQTFVADEFGRSEGGARVMAIHDWIARHFTYQAGVSSADTTAIESFVLRQGVCRDYAHVMITLLRASAIPARFASVYALGVEPQDFHAVAEVFLDGGWHLIDPTGMARASGMARIGVGRDAADTSFLTSYGAATLNRQTVEVLPG